MTLHFTILGKLAMFTKCNYYELLDLCKAELKNFEIMLVGGLGGLFSALNNLSNLIKISIVIPV